MADNFNLFGRSPMPKITPMDIDWRDCAVVETVPGKMGGQPVLKGTRLRPEDLLVNREQGIDWLVENYGGVTPETIRAVFDFYDRHQRARIPHPA